MGQRYNFFFKRKRKNGKNFVLSIKRTVKQYGQMKKEPLVIVTLFDKILCSDLHPDGPIPHATGRCDGR